VPAPVQLYNTLTGRKETLETLEPGKVRMYVCGDTVYAPSHVGHARAKMAFDTVYRYLTYRGYDVYYARNFTDIDDKIIDRALEEGVDFRVITERYIKLFYEGMDTMFVLRPDVEPRCTDHIDGIVEMNEVLISKGHAYEVEGDVYFHVPSMPNYGRLANRRLEDQEEGARVDVDSRKKHPFDFALWKSSKPGEPSWESPWGPGRPGWHIECSVMSTAELGPHFDIHGGGIDLVFPHHENEIAQSECAHGDGEWVRYWMHNGHLTIDSTKMSKSLGNTFTVGDIIARYHPEALRLFYLSAHYRGPQDYNEDSMTESEQRLERLYRTLADLDSRIGSTHPNPTADDDGGWRKTSLYLPTVDLLEDADPGQYSGPERGLFEQTRRFMERIEHFMDDDFNTAGALGHLFDFVRRLNKWLATDPDLSRPELKLLAEGARDRFYRLGAILGLFHEDAASFFDGLRDRRLSFLGIGEEEINEVIARRNDARANKDWAESDRLRDEIAERGVVLKDGPEGTSWMVRGGHQSSS
jgi:cysteinyl-tRNA synthetase